MMITISVRVDNDGPIRAKRLNAHIVTIFTLFLKATIMFPKAKVDLVSLGISHTIPTQKKIFVTHGRTVPKVIKDTLPGTEILKTNLTLNSTS